MITFVPANSSNRLSAKSSVKKQWPQVPQFSGNIGRSDMDNFLKPNVLIRWQQKRKESQVFWQTAKHSFEQLQTRMKAKGLSEVTRDSVHRFTLSVLGTPQGFDFNLSNKGYQRYLKTLDKSQKERLMYSLQRFEVFIVDHFASVFDALENDPQWETVGWFLEGLMKHPDNQNVMLTNQPLGLSCKKLAQMLETQSIYWKVFEQSQIKFNEAIQPLSDSKKEMAKAFFAVTIFYPLLRELPDQKTVASALNQFSEQYLASILQSFSNYSKQLLVDPESDHLFSDFLKFSQNSVQNLMHLLIVTDKMTKPAKPRYAPHQVKPPLVINHTPFNHLMRDFEQEK